jgi:AraC-like DNA-binding protein
MASMLESVDLLAAAMPLVRFRVTDASSAETARDHFRSRFPWTRLEPEPGEFRLVSHHVPIGRLRLVTSVSTGCAAVTADGEDYCFLLHLGGAGVTQARVGGSELGVDTRRGLLVSRQRVVVDMAPDSIRLILAAPEAALRRRLEAAIGQDQVRLPSFEPALPLDEVPGAGLARLLRVLIEELEGEPSIAEAPLVLTAWEDLLLSYLLTQVPSGRAHEIADPGAAAAPWQVRQAEAWLEAHACEPITMEELARALGISLRTLQHGFRRARGLSPRQFLRGCRLELARRRLLAPDPGTSVTAVALDCGFGHLGDFAAAYKARFTESPSATLRRRR